MSTAGPTQPGARTGSWKYQAGHRFTRGQPVYLQAPGTYALASADTGFDGLVGDIGVNRFELVTNGQLDGLSGLTPNQVYSLTPAAGAVTPGTAYPVYKALAIDTASIIAANTGTDGTDVVLPFTVSVAPIPNGVPKAYPDGTIDPGWIPSGLPYEPAGAIAAHKADPCAHSQYVRAPSAGGVLNIDNGCLLFNVDNLTQVIVLEACQEV